MNRRAGSEGIVGASLALALTLAGPAGAAEATGPAVLRPDAGPLLLGRNMEVLRDQTGRLAFEQVRAPAVAQQFAPGNADRYRRGFTPDAWWYRVALVNEGGGSDWVLEMAYPILDHVDFHLARSDGTLQRIATGDLRPAPPEQLPIRTFAVPFQFAPGEAATLHVRVQTSSLHAVELTAWSARDFQARIYRDTLRNGFYYGILLVMALYNLIVYVAIRHRAYLYYVLWIASLGFATALLAGFARLHLNPVLPGAMAALSASTPFAWTVVGLTSLAFFREFLQTRSQLPRLHAFSTAVLALGGGLVLLNFAIPTVHGNQLGVSYAAFTSALGLAAGVVLALTGSRGARLFLCAWGFFIGVFVVAVVTAVADLPGLHHLWSLIQIGVSLGVTVLALALADQVNTERRERALAREHANRLRSFLPERVADLVQGGDRSLLEPKRRQITVCVIDLRGFTPFSETAAPEDVMSVLREYFETMGAIVEEHGGTVEHFAGDSMLIFFNAPLEIADPDEQAVRTALEMRTAFEGLQAKWIKLGHELGLGIGIADGYATIGAIGFSGRSQYAAIGAVTNLASRLCSLASHGEILVTGRVLTSVEGLFETVDAGEQAIKGFHRPVRVARVIGPKTAARPDPSHPPVGVAA